MALKKAVQEEMQAEEIGEYLVENVNRLNEAARELAEINGKEPTIEELAEHLHRTKEEVREFMKISLNGDISLRCWSTINLSLEMRWLLPQSMYLTRRRHRSPSTTSLVSAKKR